MNKKGSNLKRKSNKKPVKGTYQTTGRLHFGKYKGRLIEECPSSYLLYIAENFDDGSLCYDADEEYQYREKYCKHWEENE